MPGIQGNTRVKRRASTNIWWIPKRYLKFLLRQYLAFRVYKNCQWDSKSDSDGAGPITATDLENSINIVTSQSKS